MLVDNEVVHDSRVRKQAESMASAGWDVLLIGRSPGPHRRRFMLGEARVLLVPVNRDLARRRHQMRHPALRGSIAYRSQRLKRYRIAEVAAQRADLRIDRATSGVVRRPLLMMRRVWLALESRWVDRRAAATDALAETAATRLESPIAQFWTKLHQRVQGDRVWRTFDPHLWDFELAYGAAIDRAEPDIVHANDVRMIGVAARAVTRAKAAGRTPAMVYDAHEYVVGISRPGHHPWFLPAQVAHEREYVHCADAVVTVSETLAEMLEDELRLRERPTVVLNAPLVAQEQGTASVPSMRELCGIGTEVPLLVYSGGMTEQRGVGIMVRTLPRLPDAHVAFVISKPDSPFVVALMEEARELGVRDRVHLLPYVDPEHVVSYVSEADVGVHPTHHHPNHEISLATKFFEYSHAHLPIVVSDVRTMGDMVRHTGQGEVFRAEDEDDYLRAIQAVLEDPQRYRAVYGQAELLATWKWEGQAEKLDAVYARLRARQPR